MKRIITTRLEKYNLESKHWLKESQEIYNLDSIKSVIVSHVFDFTNISNEDFEIVKNVLSSDLSTITFEIEASVPYFQIKAVDGQFDDTLSRIQTLINKFHNIDTEISHSLLFSFPNASKSDVNEFKAQLINPYEYVEYDTQFEIVDTSNEMNPIEGFNDLNEVELINFKENLAMEIDDLIVIQDYFKSIKRNPSMTELMIIDTYWSDHCRHTTFFTHLDNLVINDKRVQKAYESYLETRSVVYTDKVNPITLMDLATINAKEISKKGLLNDWDKSDEVNAISLNVDIKVNDKLEGWQLLFKNETHNHPTEIEPYGGASTCFGGCVRDPLSGRGMVYQGLRISGSKDPRESLKDTHPQKLMSRRISQEASDGFSDYSNQIGIKSGYTKEYYHDGFEAKRLELGALVAAVRQDYIQKSEPVEDDVILLIGGKTGRDGLGAAVGSSKTQTEDSLLSAGAEVQKGDPIMEHKVVRLFRREEALRLIKRCNDFGAGGVSVAIGELADGLIIDLDKVSTKYPLHGGEIALSESQERMAVVIDPKDVKEFKRLCSLEDLEVSEVAIVTSEKVMKMVYQGREIVSLDRSFLDTNGAVKKVDVVIEKMEAENNKVEVTEENLLNAIKSLAGASQKGLREKFNSTIMRGNMYAGNEISQEGMVSKFPVSNTDAVSFMSAGYPLNLSDDPFKLGYMSVVEAISRLVAMGANPKHARLSMQEYFERLVSKEKWGKPYAALLGAFSVMKEWDLPALGGKDSMSGTFEQLNVPPTLITFALTHGTKSHVISRNLKKVNSKIVWVKPKELDGLLDLDSLMSSYENIHNLILDNKIYSASTITTSIFNSLFEMVLGSDYGLHIYENDNLLDFDYGGLLLEVDENFDLGIDVAKVIKDKTIKVLDIEFDKETLKTHHETTLESIYPILQLESKNPIINESENIFKIRKNIPTATLVMFEGVNGDFDCRLQLQEANFNVNEVIIRLNDYENSLSTLKDSLENSDVLVLPHAHVRDNNVLDGGVEYAAIFNHPILKDTLCNYKGEIVGIGHGALGLIKLGLLGNVELVTIGKHYYSSEALVVSDTHPSLVDSLNECLTVPMTSPFAIKSFANSTSILEQKEGPINCSSTIGLAKNNVIGFLGSIDQIESNIFKNLSKYMMEENV